MAAASSTSSTNGVSVGPSTIASSRPRAPSARACRTDAPSAARAPRSRRRAQASAPHGPWREERQLRSRTDTAPRGNGSAADRWRPFNPSSWTASWNASPPRQAGSCPRPVTGMRRIRPPAVAAPALGGGTEALVAADGASVRQARADGASAWMRRSCSARQRRRSSSSSSSPRHRRAGPAAGAHGLSTRLADRLHPPGLRRRNRGQRRHGAAHPAADPGAGAVTRELERSPWRGRCCSSLRRRNDGSRPLGRAPAMRTDGMRVAQQAVRGRGAAGARRTRQMGSEGREQLQEVEYRYLESCVLSSRTYAASGWRSSTSSRRAGSRSSTRSRTSGQGRCGSPDGPSAARRRGRPDGI